ncbi:hypothetical protein SPBR_02887 [Sporothrix brasiliensis 5110]|uniref:Rhodopsin domain-containing protein n=1 Tax=Sporothrix brasiliensis 5110 TaxID=1398154 RepID=A0A0C2J707_9PEZI|nr:uncharacterized protein SPBR_02887 [Sporothrix brasiliensis 5110]KIH92812.1 hypothetical protein SPBR_02887 [Sporothrix brasiliensis 5110]
MAKHLPGLLPGSWALWSIGMATVFARFLSRRLALGSWRKLQLDDYLMALCVLTFTGVTVCSNQVGISGSNYASDAEIATWSPAETRDAEWGSKMLLALEECMMATVWLVKACLLILYGRLTSGLTEAFAVKVVAIYCAVGYVVVQILYLGVWCRPIDDYWAVPVPEGHEQCKTYLHHMITVTVFHVSSDLLMLLVPVPMIARAKLPLLRKIILCGIFSLGLLVVLVAILNRYYNFTVANSLVFLIWYNGEASTAVMVANIPFCWTLLRRLFALDAWGMSSRRSRSTSGAYRLGDRDIPVGSGGAAGAAATASTTETTVGRGGVSQAGRRPFATLVGIDLASTTGSTERITAGQTGDAAVDHLDCRNHDKRAAYGAHKGSSDGDYDPEIGL